MTIVSSKEFATHQRKYYKLAVNERVAIKRGESLFHLTYVPNEIRYPEQPVLEPDDDLRNGLTKEEFKEKAHAIIHNFFANK
jgi:predicted transcriptional regulator